MPFPGICGFAGERHAGACDMWLQARVLIYKCPVWVLESKAGKDALKLARLEADTWSGIPCVWIPNSHPRFPGSSAVKKKIHLPMQEIRVQCLVREDPLEEGMATHCSTPAWRIPWIEEPGRATVSGVARFWATKQQQRVTHLCLGASASFTKRVSKSSSLSSCSNNLSTQTVVLRTQRIDTNISESEWGPEVTQTAFFAGGEKKACGLFFLWINNTVREAYEFKKKKKRKEMKL